MAFPNMTTFKQRLRGKSSAAVALDREQLVDETLSQTRTVRESSYGEASKTDVQDDKKVNSTNNTAARPTLLNAMRARAKAAMSKRVGKPSKDSEPVPVTSQQKVTSDEIEVEAASALIEESEGEEEELVLATDLCRDVKVAAVAAEEDAELAADVAPASEAAEAIEVPTNDLRPTSSPPPPSSLLTTATVLLVVCVVVAMAVTRAR